MSAFLFCTVVVTLSMHVKHVTPQTMTDVTSLYTHLLTGYDVRVRPTDVDQQQATNMTLTFSLNFIKNVDLTTGEFTVFGSITTQWKDPRMAWTPSTHGGAYSVNVPSNSVWTPKFETVFNGFDVSDDGEHKDYDVQFVYDGTAIWTFENKLRAICNYDVTDYPFDMQICSIVISPVGLTVSKLRLTSVTSSADVTDLVPNDVWDYVSSSITVSDEGNKVFVNVEVHISRKHGIYRLMTYSPFVFIFILNLFLLVLPADSVERLGLSILCFLSLIILPRSDLLTLPQNIYPLSKIVIILLTTYLISAIICVCVIIQRRCSNGREPKHRQQIWNYSLSNGDTHTGVRMSPSAEGKEVSKCEETHDI